MLIGVWISTSLCFCRVTYLNNPSRNKSTTISIFNFQHIMYLRTSDMSTRMPLAVHDWHRKFMLTESPVIKVYWYGGHSLPGEMVCNQFRSTKRLEIGFGLWSRISPLWQSVRLRPTNGAGHALEFLTLVLGCPLRSNCETCWSSNFWRKFL